MGISSLDKKRIEYLCNVALVDSKGQACGRRAATAADIEACSDSFRELELGGVSIPPIPEDYGEFLMINDGFEENGMRFYGTQRLVFSSKYALIDLYTVNVSHHDARGPRLQDMLVIGGFDDTLIVYSGIDEMYHMLDMDTLEIAESYDSFAELFLIEAADLIFSTRSDEEADMYYSTFDVQAED